MRTIQAVRVVDRVQDQADVIGELVDGATLVWGSDADAFELRTLTSVVLASEIDPAKILHGTAAIDITGTAARAESIDGGYY